MCRLRQVLIALVLTLAAAVAATAAFAPQILTLAREGFPSPSWPASGDFALVAGCNSDAPPAPGCPLGRSQISPPEADARATPPAGSDFPPAALTRFANSEGRALLLDRSGRIAETYVPGMDREVRLNSYSLVKGLVGALILRAIADRRIGGLDTPLPELLGPDAPPITVSEALTMTGGLYLSGEPDKMMEDEGFAPWGGLARLHAYGLDRGHGAAAS